MMRRRPELEPSKDLRIDPALCLAAALGRDDDRTLNVCGALIDNAKTEKPTASRR